MRCNHSPWLLLYLRSHSCLACQHSKRCYSVPQCNMFGEIYSCSVRFSSWRSLPFTIEKSSRLNLFSTPLRLCNVNYSPTHSTHHFFPKLDYPYSYLDLPFFYLFKRLFSPLNYAYAYASMHGCLDMGAFFLRREKGRVRASELVSNCESQQL